MWNLVEKIQGGMHELLENSGGPFIVILPDLKEAPLNSQRFLGDVSPRGKGRWYLPKATNICMIDTILKKRQKYSSTNIAQYGVHP